MVGAASWSASRQENHGKPITTYRLPKRPCVTDQHGARLFRIASTGECHEFYMHDYSSERDAAALIMLVPTQAIWKQAMQISFPETLPKSYFVGKQYFSADAPPLGAYQQAPEDVGIAVMAQWETDYIRQARSWRRRISPITNVEDLCADRLGRDSVVGSIASAHIVLYFGHGHYSGLDGYHGITKEHFLPDRPIGLFWSWSCNTLCGRHSFAIRLLQAGLVKAYVGTTNPKARSCDNLRLAEISASVLLRHRPATLMEWYYKLTLSVQALGDEQLSAAWADYQVLGDITLKLPEFK